MFESFTVVGIAAGPRRALRVAGLLGMAILACGAALGVWVLAGGGSVEYRGGSFSGPFWGALLIVGAVGGGAAMRGELSLAFKDPALVSGSDVVGGILLTQRRGPGKGATVLLPERTQVVLTPVQTASQRGVAMCGLQVATVQGATLLDLSMKPSSWDLSPGSPHLARHGIQFVVQGVGAGAQSQR